MAIRSCLLYLGGSWGIGVSGIWKLRARRIGVFGVWSIEFLLSQLSSDWLFDTPPRQLFNFQFNISIFNNALNSFNVS